SSIFQIIVLIWQLNFEYTKHKCTSLRIAAPRVDIFDLPQVSTNQLGHPFIPCIDSLTPH
ncbi:MAG: hypothetical protein ABL875_05900, partial [Candidatus Nitrotoga sp.]